MKANNIEALELLLGARRQNDGREPPARSGEHLRHNGADREHVSRQRDLARHRQLAPDRPGRERRHQQPRSRPRPRRRPAHPGRAARADARRCPGGTPDRGRTARRSPAATKARAEQTPPSDRPPARVSDSRPSPGRHSTSKNDTKPVPCPSVPRPAVVPGRLVLSTTAVSEHTGAPRTSPRTTGVISTTDRRKSAAVLRCRSISTRGRPSEPTSSTGSHAQYTVVCAMCFGSEY